MARAQEQDGKVPFDMQRLLAVNGNVIVTNFTPPVRVNGKKGNGGKVSQLHLCDAPLTAPTPTSDRP